MSSKSSQFFGVVVGNFCFFSYFNNGEVDVMLLPKSKISDFEDKSSLDLFNKRSIPHLVINLKKDEFYFYIWNKNYKKEIVHRVNKGDYCVYECSNCGKCDKCNEALRLKAKEVYSVSAALLQNYFMSESYTQVNIWGKMSVYGSHLLCQNIYLAICEKSLVGKIFNFLGVK